MSLDSELDRIRPVTALVVDIAARSGRSSVTVEVGIGFHFATLQPQMPGPGGVRMA